MSITNAMKEVLNHLNVVDTIDSEFIDGNRYIGSDSQGTVVTLTESTVEVNGGPTVKYEELPINVQKHVNTMVSLIARSNPHDAACPYCGNIDCTGAPVCQL